METIVINLIKGTSPDNPPNEISTCLNNFVREMDINELSKAVHKSSQSSNESNEVDCYLRSIWTALLSCASHSSSSVRVAAYSATWSFLAKTMSKYPKLMQNSFNDIANHFSGESNASILLISSFAFISNFVSPNKMEEFLNTTPLFHHFLADESINSEHLSNIISNLSPNISNEWFKTLLLAFIKKLKVSSSSPNNRHIFKAIAALIKKNQTFLLPEILINDEKTVFPGQLSLISFILSSPTHNDENELFFTIKSLNLKKTAIAAFNILKNHQNLSMLEIDDALSILSLRSDSFKVIVNPVEGKDGFLITLDGYDSFVFDDQKSLQRPAFYLLPLPKKYLMPSASETASIIGAKLKTLGMSLFDHNIIRDVEEEIDLIDSLCSNDNYNETISCCLQCISICANSLILNTKSHKLSRLLRKLIFAKPVSWFHSYNILMVIKSIRTDLIPIVLGPSGFRDIVKTVVSFCLNMNQDLSRSSFETLAKLTSDDTFYEVTNYVSKNIDFFNSFSLQKHLQILSGLISLHINQDRSHLSWLFEAVLESLNDHILDLNAVSAIFRFFSYFNIKKYPEEVTEPVIKIAKIILKSAMDIYKKGYSNSSLTDSPSSSDLLNQESLFDSYETNKEAIKTTIYNVMRSYMESKKIEILSPRCCDYQIHFYQIYSIMKFFLSLHPSVFSSHKMSNTFLWCFRMFPLECSIYLSRRIKYFNDEMKIKIIKKCTEYLDSIPNVKCHQFWCGIAMTQLNLEDRDFEKIWLSFIKTMFDYTRDFARCEMKIPLDSVIGFSLFIGFISSNTKALDIDVNKLCKELYTCSSYEEINPFVEYINMYVGKLTDMEKISFFQKIEKNNNFKGNFPQVIYRISANYTIPKSTDTAKEHLLQFNDFIDPQKMQVLKEICKRDFSENVEIPDEVISYAEEKFYGWKLLSYYKKLAKLNISSPLSSKIKQQLKAESRAFNPLCRQSLDLKNIQKKLQFYSDMNSLLDTKIVLCLIKESFEKNPNLVDFSSISFTQSMIPCIAKFIKNAKSKKDSNLTFDKAEEKMQKEMPLIKYFFNPDLEFKLESNHRKLTKALIYQICKFMEEFNMIIKGIDKEIINSLKETHSFNRTRALLTISSVYISMLSKNMNNLNDENPIEKNVNDFAESIFTILESKTNEDSENENVIPQRELLNFALSLNKFQIRLLEISRKNKNKEKKYKIKIRRKSLFRINELDVNQAIDNENEGIQQSALEKNISFIDQHCKLYVFPDCLTLHLLNSPKIKFEDSINDIILNSNHPSFILQSIRALRCIYAIGDIASISFNIVEYIKRFHQFISIYPVSYYTSYLLVDMIGSSNILNNEALQLEIQKNTESNAVFSNENDELPTKRIRSSPSLILSANATLIKSIRNTIIDELFSSILVPISKASFYPLGKIIVALIESETNSKTKFYQKLINECEKIIEDGISSFLLFKLYLEILTARIRKIQEKYDIVAKDSITKLVSIYRNGVNFQNILCNAKGIKYDPNKTDDSPTFDSYFIDDYLSAMLKLMNEFCSVEEMLSHFIEKVLPVVPRFFPSFVAIAKIIKQSKYSNYDDLLLKTKRFINDDQFLALNRILKEPMSDEILELASGTVKL